MSWNKKEDADRLPCGAIRMNYERKATLLRARCYVSGCSDLPVNGSKFCEYHAKPVERGQPMKRLMAGRA